MRLIGRVLAIVLIPICATANAQDSIRADLPVPVIVGPTGGRPGDLIVLDASNSDASHFAWEVVPELSNDRLTIMPIEGGTKCILVSVPGQYTVMLAVSNADGIATKKHTVIITQLGPQPGPQPTPQPSPQPLPDGKYKLAASVVDWSQLVGDTRKANDLANNFESVASGAAAGAFRNVEELKTETFEGNRKAVGQDRELWLPFMEQLQAELERLAREGKLSTMDDHVTAWEEISIGLRRVGK